MMHMARTLVQISLFFPIRALFCIGALQFTALQTAVRMICEKDTFLNLNSGNLPPRACARTRAMPQQISRNAGNHRALIPATLPRAAFVIGETSTS
jgi:hypothetical protein